ncbi:MAG: alcohol dehydrogenase catalytic domain-containing protein, partial [bacterium]|nr:alcohol dehydrogenase catalytic domain-containing protein [bacterium]
VRVEASGICGSDVMEWYRINRVPLVLGHEIAGTIEEVGAGVKNFQKGDRVACAHHLPCQNCRYCLSGHETVCETLRKTNFDPGGFSEFVRLPAINVEKGTFILPKNVSFIDASFVEPLACVLRGQRLSGGAKNKRVLVVGSGITGILHLHLAKFSGAAEITATDIAEPRLKMAKKFGADFAVNAKEYSAGKFFDLVIVTTGAPSAIKQAMESVERGGTILFFAPVENDREVPIPFNKLFWRAEITLASSYAGSPQDYQQALDLIATGKLNLREMITHRLGLEKIGLGFQLVSEAKDSLKVVIEPQGG